MGQLIFRCPKTANVLQAGIETNKQSLVPAMHLAMKVFCPYCRLEHHLPISQGVLKEGSIRRANRSHCVYRWGRGVDWTPRLDVSHGRAQGTAANL